MEENLLTKIVKNLLVLPLVLYYTLEAIVLFCIPRKLRYKDVKNETVLITGAGNGVGRELAVKFSGLGCRVILVDINRKWMDQTRKMIAEKSGKVYAYQCDISNRAAIYEMAEKIKDEVGTVDILVNNAGIVTGKRFLDCPDDKILKTFEVNTLAHFWTCKAFLPDMIKKNHGHIVTVASLAGFAGGPRAVDYCSSKFAAVGFDESLRNELFVEEVKGVRFTLVCSYFITTGLFDGFKASILKPLTAEYVADEIVSGVRANQEVILIPWWSWFTILLKWLLPWSALRVLIEPFGLLKGMHGFKGRQETD